MVTLHRRLSRFIVQRLNLNSSCKLQRLFPTNRYKIVLNKGAMKYSGSFLILFAHFVVVMKKLIKTNFHGSFAGKLDANPFFFTGT